MESTVKLLRLAIAIVLLAGNVLLFAQKTELFAQASSAELERRFGGGDLSWVLLDGTGGVLSINWGDADTPISPGSLLKLFVAVTYGEQYGFRYPSVKCLGTRTRCWLPHGHGVVRLNQAIAGSCNTYFLALADQLDASRVREIVQRFGLAGPPAGSGPEVLVGLADGWREKPLSLARAYLSLVIHTPEPARGLILAGMSSAAETGTARELDGALGAHAALAKTGTAACAHHPRAAADGFTIALYPASQPRVLLLVREHGQTGAHAANRAGAMLRAIGMGAQ